MLGVLILLSSVFIVFVQALLECCFLLDQMADVGVPLGIILSCYDLSL